MYYLLEKIRASVLFISAIFTVSFVCVVLYTPAISINDLLIGAILFSIGNLYGLYLWFRERRIPESLGNLLAIIVAVTASIAAFKNGFIALSLYPFVLVICLFLANRAIYGLISIGLLGTSIYIASITIGQDFYSAIRVCLSIASIVTLGQIIHVFLYRYMQEQDASISELTKNEQKLVQRAETLERDKMAAEEQAYSDSLTGLFNRRKLNECVPELIEQCEQEQKPLAAILLDIDHFKSVNDEYGHAAGDKVLIEIAKVIHQNIRESDMAFRFGGEEFLIVCPNLSLPQATRLAETVREQVYSTSFSLVPKQSASFGVTERVTNETSSAIIARADRALYRAKQNGRNQVVADSVVA
ncbi:GGDEF domain-containing protein [Marinomonas ostreistagni]|uniref:diguanylate cyclase n=1 Tax=Marinomonas ostreistagni TaxID=359209 RepID=A0ABS0ZBW8_9GAMM|nr:GGDEF domain-containing protein [Marinomonas ostreistagni]MBJ7551160.1 GGDEF domain-containing protein [Marinomonas ostreistagni]